jgi:hypothetical protein
VNSEACLIKLIKTRKSMDRSNISHANRSAGRQILRIMKKKALFKSKNVVFTFVQSNEEDLQGTDFYRVLVGTGGLEPPTPTMSRWCSNQLSYVPIRRRIIITPLQQYKVLTEFYKPDLQVVKKRCFISDNLSLIFAAASNSKFLACFCISCSSVLRSLANSALDILSASSK